MIKVSDETLKAINAVKKSFNAKLRITDREEIGMFGSNLDLVAHVTGYKGRFPPFLKVYLSFGDKPNKDARLLLATAPFISISSEVTYNYPLTESGAGSYNVTMTYPTSLGHETVTITIRDMNMEILVYKTEDLDFISREMQILEHG